MGVKRIAISSARDALTARGIFKRDGWRVEHSGDCPPGLLEKLVAALGFGIPSDWTPLKGSSVSKVYRFDFEGACYVFKEYRPRSPFESLKARLRGSRAERACIGSRLLEDNGFLAPALVCWGERTGAGLAVRCFTVTRFIPEACGLFTLLRDRLPALPVPESAAIRRRLARGLGAAIGRLHRLGIIHGDLRLDNIMVMGWDTEAPKFYFIDNERNSIHREAPPGLVAKNLVQVNMVKLTLFPARERTLFFKSYLEAFPAMKNRKRGLSKEVLEITGKRMTGHGGL